MKDMDQAVMIGDRRREKIERRLALRRQKNRAKSLENMLMMMISAIVSLSILSIFILIYVDEYINNGPTKGDEGVTGLVFIIIVALMSYGMYNIIKRK